MLSIELLNKADAQSVQSLINELNREREQAVRFYETSEGLESMPQGMKEFWTDKAKYYGSSMRVLAEIKVVYEQCDDMPVFKTALETIFQSEINGLKNFHSLETVLHDRFQEGEALVLENGKFFSDYTFFSGLSKDNHFSAINALKTTENRILNARTKNAVVVKNGTLICAPNGLVGEEYEIDGSKIHTIGWNAFYGCKDLNYLSVGEGVTEIQNKALYSCGNLGRIDLPSTLENLGSDTFNTEEVCCVCFPNGINPELIKDPKAFMAAFPSNTFKEGRYGGNFQFLVENNLFSPKVFAEKILNAEQFGIENTQTKMPVATSEVQMY